MNLASLVSARSSAINGSGIRRVFDEAAATPGAIKLFIGQPDFPIDPLITKAASPSEARTGDEIVFTLTVTNRGNVPAENVVVTDPVPDFCDILDVSASRGDVAVGGNTVVVTLGAVAPDEVITILVRTRVNERAQPPGGVNTVTLTSSSSSDDPSNNTSSVTVVIQVPDPTAQGTEDTASVTIKTRSLKASADFNGFVQDEFERSKGQSGYENDSTNKDSSVHRYFVARNKTRYLVRDAYLLTSNIAIELRCQRPLLEGTPQTWNDTFDANCASVFASLKR